MEPASSQILLRFVTTKPQWDRPPGVWVYFWALYSVPLIHMIVFEQISCWGFFWPQLQHVEVPVQGTRVTAVTRPDP